MFIVPFTKRCPKDPVEVVTISVNEPVPEAVICWNEKLDETELLEPEVPKNNLPLSTLIASSPCFKELGVDDPAPFFIIIVLAICYKYIIM
tara:strand:- start:273 stop:545 length:273 start_codon:yes stop_codon:yes gene_type:complete